MFNVEIADVVIQIDNKYSQIEYLCKDYISNKTATMFITATEEEIQEELKNITESYEGIEAYYECIVIYRKICYGMLNYDGFLLHSSVIQVDNKAYAFCAPSGTGKTTHTLLWTQVFKDKATYVNGDKPILRFIDNTLYACGTPWKGKEGYGDNIKVTLQGIIFIQRSETNSIERLPTREILGKLFRQLLIPKEDQSMSKFMELLDKTLKTVPCYLLKCNMDPEAAKVAYTGLMEG